MLQNYIQSAIGFKKDVVTTHANRTHKYEHEGTECYPQIMQSDSVSLKTSPGAREVSGKKSLNFAVSNSGNININTTRLLKLLYLMQVEQLPCIINL